MHFQKKMSYQRLNTAQVDSQTPFTVPVNVLTHSRVLISRGEVPLRQTDIYASRLRGPRSQGSFKHCPDPPSLTLDSAEVLRGRVKTSLVPGAQ